MRAALLTGLAFSNTQTTICHALSYRLTNGWGVPHGQAVAVSLPLMIQKIMPVIEQPRQRALLSALGVSDITAARDRINQLLRSIGLVTTLGELGIGEDSLTELATAALAANRIDNSPIIPSATELAEWLKQLQPLSPIPLVSTVTEPTDRRPWLSDLVEVGHLLDRAKVEYWLDMGTLLGVVREGNFIAWDNDIDLSMSVSDAPKVLSLSDDFAKLGYRVDVTDSSIYLSCPGRPTIGLAFYRQLGDQLWILFLLKYPIGEPWLRHIRRIANKIIYSNYHRRLPRWEKFIYSICPNWLAYAIRRAAFNFNALLGEQGFPLVVPNRLVRPLAEVELGGEKFKIPGDAVGYLAWTYGDDWQTPNPNWRWEETKSINRNFSYLTNRCDYSLFNQHDVAAVEQAVIEQFEGSGEQWVEATVLVDDFELQAVISLLGQPTPPQNRLLDIGSGRGRFDSSLQKRGFMVTGVEPAANLVNEARQLNPTAEFIVGSATRLPFQDNHFDYAICVEVLEHIPDTDQAISEMRRVLRPGGQLVIIDKNINSLHYLHFIPTRWWKWWREITNQWMYPVEFPFRERYFSPANLAAQLRRCFSSADWQSVKFAPTDKPRPWVKRGFWKINQSLNQFIHSQLPDRSFYIAWRAIK